MFLVSSVSIIILLKCESNDLSTHIIRPSFTSRVNLFL